MVDHFIDDIFDEFIDEFDDSFDELDDFLDEFDEFDDFLDEFDDLLDEFDDLLDEFDDFLDEFDDLFRRLFACAHTVLKTAMQRQVACNGKTVRYAEATIHRHCLLTRKRTN